MISESEPSNSFLWDDFAKRNKESFELKELEEQMKDYFNLTDFL